MIMRRLKRSSARLKTECFPTDQLFGSKALARPRDLRIHRSLLQTIGVCTARLVIRRHASLKSAIVKEKNDFFEGKVSATLFQNA